MRKVILASVIGLVLSLSTVSVASAHTHIELPNGKCVDIPSSQEGAAHDGIGIAKSHAEVLEGGWCPED